MPTYDYECLECKDRFEVFQSMTDDPLEKCKKCGGKLKKLIGAGAGIIFKGSGFYVNDYKKGSAAANKPISPNSTSDSNGAKPSSDSQSSSTGSAAAPSSES